MSNPLDKPENAKACIDELGLIIARKDAEIRRLREVVRQRTKLLDDQLGTPCEQIRHEQDRQNMTDKIERLRALNADILAALEKIAEIENQDFGPDWEEIEQAREIARATIAKARDSQ